MQNTKYDGSHIELTRFTYFPPLPAYKLFAAEI